MLDAVRSELGWAGHPTILAIEDVHWADEATLDVLRYLVRRVARLPAVLLMTYRDDELSREHPLQQLLGQASRAARTRHLPLSRLSEEAVRQLSAGSSLDPQHVFAVTSGDPFFVAEVLASEDVGGVPPTIADAVLARIGGLDESTRDLLEQLAVVPSALHRWLVDALVPDGPARLAAAERRGLLAVSPARVSFRHELTRRAVADSIPAAWRVELNRRVLAALVDRPGSDLSRIVHHAVEAGDDDAIVRYGPEAAGEAAQAGSHREAAAHYRLVLEHRGTFAPVELAELLERYAIECYTLGNADTAVLAQRQAVELRRSLGDPSALGAALRWLSRMYWWAGDRGNAEHAGGEAIVVLEDAGDARLLALALSNQSHLHMLAGRDAEAIGVGERAITMARAVGDAAILSHALNNVGSVRWQRGDPAGRPALEESLRVALAAGEVEHACRAYINIVWDLIDGLSLLEADRFLAEGIGLAEGSEHLGFLGMMHVLQAWLGLATGAWDQAVHTAELAIDAQPPISCPAVTVLGRVRVRRGLPGGDELLVRAWEMAVRIGEAQRTGPVAAARAEAAWLRGDPAGVISAVEATYEEVRRHGNAPMRAELGYWLTKAGRPAPSEKSDHPYTLQAVGRWREAAAAWRAAGCPYEHAAALAESPEPDDLLAAVVALDALRAEPLGRLVRARLRELGVTRIPRGPVGATRENPAGLTQRQMQVLRLLGHGLTNGEIADRLVLSVRTVENHVAAVLDKLGTPRRRDAAARAGELGVLVDPEQTAQVSLDPQGIAEQRAWWRRVSNLQASSSGRLLVVHNLDGVRRSVAGLPMRSPRCENPLHILQGGHAADPRWLWPRAAVEEAGAALPASPCSARYGSMTITRFGRCGT